MNIQRDVVDAGDWGGWSIFQWWNLIDTSTTTLLLLAMVHLMNQ
jgi:hypothetical protein